MAYYLKAPRGTVPLNRLLELASTRMTFLFKLISLKENLEQFLDYLEEYVEYSECIIEGNAKDRISHYMLRLACLTNRRRRDLFVDAETLLFKLRLQQMSTKEKCQMLRIVKRHLTELDVLDVHEANRCSLKAEDIMAVLHCVVQQIRAYNLFQLEKDELESSDIAIRVPFQYVLALVSTRSVHLKGGIASVSPNKMDSLLQLLFSQLLTAEIDEGGSNYFGMSQDDERLRYMCDQLGEFFGKHELKVLSSLPVNSLTSSEIDGQSRHFPPCMRLLHAKLRHNHRLRHAARIEYSLFLKEIGLPTGEAVTFWEGEYSKPPSLNGVGQSGKCCQQWKKDKARYVYSIRHLYGLEGSKRCYSARSCATLQNMILGPLEEGGCPFKHFESKTLIACLRNWGIKESECQELASMAANEQYTPACGKFLESQAARGCSTNMTITSCVECFNSCKRSRTSGKFQSKIDANARKYMRTSDLGAAGSEQIMKNEEGFIGQLSTTENGPTIDSSSTNDRFSESVSSFSKPSEFFFIMKSSQL